MNGESLDIKQTRLQRLKELCPELFAESQLDWEKLKAAFGDDINFVNERYVLNWAGKSDAFKILQQPTTATLKAVPEESVNFDTTDNLFIEGENLEVLKVLQKAYYGKVKCIIIDPPYNTGSDSFIYPDKFSEKKEDYLKRIGDKDEEGFLMKEGLFRKNSKDSGHYHSNWLSMMYPRMFLAKNLLRDDGVIFVHIDDNEVHNLRMVMNEIFGEENFVGQIANINNPKGRSDDKFIATSHEYILVYAKRKETCYWLGFEPEEKVLRRYNKKDTKGKFREIDLRKTGDADLREDRPDMFYYFYYHEQKGDVRISKDPQSLSDYREIIPIREDGKFGRWRWGFDTAKENIDKLLFRYMPNRKIWGIFEKDYLDEREYLKPVSAWAYKDVNSERGSEQFIELGFDKNVFPKPKPVGTIKRILNLCTNANRRDIFLDFFGGSGTTAQAGLELNKEDGGNRKFILVQMPEPCDESSEAYKAGYNTIADIGKERIRRVIQKIEKEIAEKPDLFDKGKLDLGFKVFKLSPSSFKIWRGSEIDSEEKLIEQLDAFTDPSKPGAEKANMLYELMLKAGHELTSPI